MLNAGETEEEREAYTQRAVAAERNSKPVCLRQMIVDRAALAKEFTACMDAAEAWPKWLEHERLNQKMAPFEQIMYMEGDQAFLPDFPVEAEGLSTNLDDEAIAKRRKAEVELIQWAAPALSDHLDFHDTWPGPFKAVRRELRNQQELLEGPGRPSKRSRIGTIEDGGDGK